MKTKRIVLNKDRDVTLTPYIVTKDKKPTFLICPGGAYKSCDDSEGIPVAKTFNDKGFNAFILRYSVGKHYKWPYPLDDLDQAMAFLADHANEYSVDADHIITAGFSAGGHLVSVAASIAKHKPFAAIQCYGLTARETLAYCAPDAPDASDLVNLGTRPCFLASSRNDCIVPVFNTTKLMNAFESNYIDYEVHIYGYAYHGFSVGETAGAAGPLFCSRVGNWVEDCLEWIDELISGRYISIRECAAYNDQYASVLSTMNSCKHIFGSKALHKMMRHAFPAQYLIYTTARKQIGEFLDTVSLRNLFQLIKVSDKTIEKMDDALSVFPIERSLR